MTARPKLPESLQETAEKNPGFGMWAHLLPQQRAYLAAFLANKGLITAAAHAAELDPKTPFHWRKTDPAFLQAFEEARFMTAEMAEERAIERSHLSHDEDKESGRLLQFHLRGAMKEKYGTANRDDDGDQPKGGLTLVAVDKETLALFQELKEKFDK